MIAIVVVVILAGVWGVTGYRSIQRDEIQIRRRYDEMRLALAAGDKSLALSFVAPKLREAPRLDMGLLRSFVKPLGPKSAVEVWDSKAAVFPQRIFHYVVLRGGDSLGMVKVDGEWYFTGKVFID